MKTLKHTALYNFLVLFFFALILNSCSTLLLERQSINFFVETSFLPKEEVSNQELKALGIDPEQGIDLKFKAFSGMIQEYIDEGIIFSQIEDNTGIPIQIRTRTKIEFLQEDEDGWLVRSESFPEDQYSGKITRVYRMNNLGKIQLVEAEGKSNQGKIKVTEWLRSEIFPTTKVKPGDRWTYSEKMNSSIKSFWIEKLSSVPDEVNAISTFSGFVKINDKICAVINTKAMQKKKEKVKTFLKEFSIEINSYITETVYFDFLNGRIEERIVEIESFSKSAELDDFYDHTKAKIRTFYNK